MATVKLKRYDEKFIRFLKSIGARFDPGSKEWRIPLDKVKDVTARIKEYGVEAEVKPYRVGSIEAIKPRIGSIRMRLSKDGRYALIRMDLIANVSDIIELLEGSRKTVRFRILPPRKLKLEGKGSLK